MSSFEGAIRPVNRRRSATERALSVVRRLLCSWNRRLVLTNTTEFPRVPLVSRSATQRRQRSDIDRWDWMNSAFSLQSPIAHCNTPVVYSSAYHVGFHRCSFRCYESLLKLTFHIFILVCYKGKSPIPEFLHRSVLFMKTLEQYLAWEIHWNEAFLAHDSVLSPVRLYDTIRYDRRV